MGSTSNTAAINGSVGKLKSTSESMPISLSVMASGVKKTIEKTKVSNEKKAMHIKAIAKGSKV